jgi:hypothetical protein
VLGEMIMFDTEQEKERLTNILSEQYSQDLIAIDEYERLLDFVNKTETNKEIEYIRKIIDTNNTYTLKKTDSADENPRNTLPALFKSSRLPRKRNIKKIKSFSGKNELRLIDIDFIENILTIKLNIFGGDIIIYIAHNVAVENNVRSFGGDITIDNQQDISNDEIKNKLILIGNIYGGNIHIMYVK